MSFVPYEALSWGTEQIKHSNRPKYLQVNNFISTTLLRAQYELE